MSSSENTVPDRESAAENRPSGWSVPGARTSLVAGILLATAVFTIVDETILHLLLHWHHFYDRSTPGVAMLSDGLFQAVGVVALVASGYLYADLRRRGVWRPLWQATGFFLALGVIGLVDEVLIHKLLNWHQIHYGDEVWKYDAGAGVCIVASLLVGGVLLRRSLRSPDGGIRLDLGGSKGLDVPDSTR
ncbi:MULTISPECIES: DUF2243 domain-containing protein [Nocardia]|nr:DUF2243 domain-containing protein [Nocardia mangyaensis]